MAKRRSIRRPSQETQAPKGQPKHTALVKGSVCCSRCWKPLASDRAEFIRLYESEKIQVGTWNRRFKAFSALCADPNCAPYDADRFEKARNHGRALLVEKWDLYTKREGKLSVLCENGKQHSQTTSAKPQPKPEPQTTSENTKSEAQASMQAAKAASRKADSEAFAAKAAELEAVEQSKGLPQQEEPTAQQFPPLKYERSGDGHFWQPLVGKLTVDSLKAEVKSHRDYIDDLQAELDSLKAENAKLKAAMRNLLQ